MWFSENCANHSILNTSYGSLLSSTACCERGRLSFIIQDSHSVSSNPVSGRKFFCHVFETMFPAFITCRLIVFLTLLVFHPCEVHKQKCLSVTYQMQLVSSRHLLFQLLLELAVSACVKFLVYREKYQIMKSYQWDNYTGDNCKAVQKMPV